MSTKSRPIVTGINPSEHYTIYIEITTGEEVVTTAAKILRSEFNFETGETIRFCKLGETDGYAVFATDYGERIFHGTSEVYDHYSYDKAFNKYVCMIKVS